MKVLTLLVISGLLSASTAHSLAKAAPTIQYVGAMSINACQEIEIVADWYQKFGIDLKPEGDIYFGSFETPAGPFYFAVHPKRDDAPKKSSGSVSIDFRVSDFNGYASMLEKRGLKPESVETYSYGRFAHYRDPDGNEMTVWGD